MVRFEEILTRCSFYIVQVLRSASPAVLISACERFLFSLCMRDAHDADIPWGWHLLYFAKEAFYFSWFPICTPLCSGKLISFVFREADSRATLYRVIISFYFWNVILQVVLPSLRSMLLYGFFGDVERRNAPWIL